MRILYCNKYNFSFSGTEVYLFELMDLMRSRGHEVALFSMADERGTVTAYDKHFVPHIDFKAKAGLWRKSLQAAHAIYSTEARRRLRAMIADFRPDVAHVRNIYHHLSPSILWELKAQGIPVLYHVNDFKLLCPSYNLTSQGEACDVCRRGSFWHALHPQCYPGLGARMMLVTEAYVQRWLGSYRKCIDLFLAPSRFVRDKFIEHSWDGNKFRVLPHFQRPQDSPEPPIAPAPLLYFGRLSPEKGVVDLLHAMRQLPHIRLLIAGDGGQRAELEQLAGSLGLANVEFLGHVERAQLDSLIAASGFTLMPSHAYETFGKAILESYAHGRAVIASDRGSRRELVRHGETGLLYRCGDVNQLVQSIQLLTSDPDLAVRMGRAGWRLVREQYTPEAHYQELLSIYERLCARNGVRSGGQR